MFDQFTRIVVSESIPSHATIVMPAQAGTRPSAGRTWIPPVEDRPFFHGAGMTPKVELAGDQAVLRFVLVDPDYPTR